MPGKTKDLDGFWAHGKKQSSTLAVFVHGMGGNFFRSPFKKQFLLQGPRAGIDVVSCHNSGALDGVTDERFAHCMRDLDAVLHFAKTRGYRRFILIGHSTGCQKIVYWQSRRQDPSVAALILAAPADDLALAKRELGSRFSFWVKRARDYVANGEGHTLMPEKCNGFTARRFLSVADPKQAEAAVFDYSGRMKHFRTITTPTFALFGSKEQFAVLDVDDMGTLLTTITSATPFRYQTVDGGDHGFTGVETKTVQTIFRWLRRVTQGSSK